MSKKRRYTLGAFGPASGPITAAGVSLAVAGWGAQFGLSPWYAAATAGACGLLTLAHSVRAGLPGFARVHQVGCWAVFGSWTFWALSSTPWAVDALASLGALTAVTAVSTKAAMVHAQTVAEHQKQADEATRRRGIAGQWERRIAKICHLRFDPADKAQGVTGLDEWYRPVPGNPGETRVTGYSLLVGLPDGGYRWSDLNAKRLELASSANLPEGCGIEVRPGKRAREVIIDVTTVNVLSEDLALPAQWEKTTIYDPVPLGIQPEGRFCEVTLKWASALLIGQKRSGKSNELTTILSGVLCCDDVVVMGVDFNGGGVFLPYLRPWLEGKVQRPAIDWVATDEQEAVRMLDFVIAAVGGRKVGYAEEMERLDDDKVPSSARIPHILVVTDESNDLPVSVKNRLVEVSNRGGGASISTLVSALRAVDMGGKGLPIELNAQSAVKIAMQVDNDNELGYLFSWGRPPKREEIPGVGFGFAATEGEKPRLFKGYRTKPSTAREVAEATAERRPALDAVTVDAAGREVYEQRWERARESWLSGRAPKAQASRVSATGAAPASAADASSNAHEAVTRIFADLGLDVPDVGPAAAPEQPRGGGDATFEEMAEQSLGDLAVPDLVRVGLEMAAGEGLVHMAELARRFGVDSRRLGELMRGVGVEPRTSPWRGGRAYEHEALVACRDRIRRGLQPVPEEVWAASPAG